MTPLVSVELGVPTEALWHTTEANGASLVPASKSISSRAAGDKGTSFATAEKSFFWFAF